LLLFTWSPTHQPTAGAVSQGTCAAVRKQKTATPAALTRTVSSPSSRPKAAQPGRAAVSPLGALWVLIVPDDSAGWAASSTLAPSSSFADCRGYLVPGLVPTYSVAIPNVSGCHLTSASPCSRSFAASASPSGNSSTLAGRYS